MIVIINNSRIHSVYRDIPISLIMNIVGSGYSIMDVPESNEYSLTPGTESPINQNISETTRKKIRSLTAKLNRKIKEQTGLKWNDFLIKTTVESVTNLSVARQQLEQSNIDSVPWRFDDDQFGNLTLAELDELIMIVSKAVQKNFMDEKNEVLSL